MFPGILAPSLVPAGPGPGINHAFPDQAALVHWPRHYRGQWLMPFWLQARHPKPLPAHQPGQHFDYNTFWKTPKPKEKEWLNIKSQNYWSSVEIPLPHDDERCWDSKCSPDGSGCREMVKYWRVTSWDCMILCALFAAAKNCKVLYMYGGSTQPVWRCIRFEQMGAVAVNIKTCSAKKANTRCRFCCDVGSCGSVAYWWEIHTIWKETRGFKVDTLGGETLIWI